MAGPLKRPAHGGEAERAARELGLPLHGLLDFSASINPLGIPEGVAAAAAASLERIGHYPEPEAASLRLALAQFHGLPEVHLLPGAGSTPLIYLFSRILRPRRALVVAPAFSEYERSLSLAGSPIDLFLLRPGEDFRLDPARLLEAVDPETELVWLANPANPTGTLLPPDLLETLAEALREQAILAVDEAFADFAPECSLLDRVPRHKNLWVFRSLTKFYAIPGLRAGYLAGPAAGIAKLAAASEPWALSTPAIAAAKACLAETDFRARTLAEIPPLRNDLAEGLRSLGLTVFDSAANYLLARIEQAETSAAFLAEGLRREGILIRDCANFPPLDGRYFRVAVRSDGENRRLLEMLGRALSG